ncbi:MAG: SRPBCC domain-containing protein [Pseudomonadota bacterium]
MSDLTFTRNFKASPELVFDFVTQQDHIAKWWGPEKMHCPVLNMNLTKPGAWLSTMENKDGQHYTVSGEVVDVDPPKRVTFTWAWHDENDTRGNESRVTFEVTSDGSGGSVFTLTHRGLVDEESRNGHEQGWTSSIRKLEKLV